MCTKNIGMSKEQKDIDQTVTEPEQQDAEQWQISPASVDFESPLLNCLALLSSLYQSPVSKQALKNGLPNADTKFTPELFIRSAERAGFSSRVVHRPKITDISSLVTPCILLLKDKNACILLRFDRKKRNVEIMLPEGDGVTKKISIERLKEDYTGYAIFARPKAQLDQRAEYISLKERKDWFWGTLRKFWKIYIHVLIASFMINLFGIAGPLFVMNVYDRVVPNNAIETLWVLAAGIGLVYLFEFILKNLRSYFIDVAGKNADTIMGSRLLEHVMGLRLQHLPKSTGSMANNLKNFESLRDFFSSGTVTLFIDLPFMFLFLAIIWMIAGPVAYIPIATIPIVLLVGLVLQYPLMRVIEKSHAESSQKYALLFEALSGLETIKTNTAESKIQGLWERIVALTATSSAQGRSWSSVAMSFTSLALQFTTVMVIIYGVYEIAEGNLTMGALVAATMLTGRAMAPLANLASLLTRYQQTKISLKALDEIMKKEIERGQDKHFITLEKIQGAIEFQDVSFHYPEQQIPSIDNLSLKIRPGERVGILGRIGSGKSTIGRLLTNLYEPTEGTIMIDGTNLSQLDPADIRQNIGYVTQDNFLFYGTVRDNISFGAPNINEQSVKRAAKLSGCMDFLRHTPQGLDLHVGERGMALSGGQRQSIAIARALVCDPPILLLDEPTSDMDLATENKFIQRMEQIIADKTVILMTHRHSVLKLVNRLIIVEQGEIIADGPKDEIVERLQKGEIRSPKQEAK